MNYNLNVLTAESSWAHVQLIAFEVYDCNNRYVGNDKARSILSDFCTVNHCCAFLSPLHQPEGKKPHKHGALWVDGSRGSLSHLDGDLVFKLLDALCTDAPAPVAVPNTKEKRKQLARYSCHLTVASHDKEQFDLTDPAFDTPKDGLTNIYDKEKGFIEVNCSFINLITLTVREKASEISELRKEELNAVLDYVYTHYVDNFADLMKWARTNDKLDAVIAYNGVLKNVLSDMGSSAHFNESDKAKNAMEIRAHMNEKQKEDMRTRYARKKRSDYVNSDVKRRAYAWRALGAILATCSVQYEVKYLDKYLDVPTNVERVEDCNTFDLESMMSLSNDFTAFVEKTVFNTEQALLCDDGVVLTANKGGYSI